MLFRAAKADTRYKTHTNLTQPISLVQFLGALATWRKANISFGTSGRLYGKTRL